MPTPSDSRAVLRSHELFQRLLAFYPEQHRKEYGPAMAQVFRDQCRAAWRDGHALGLTALWLRVLPDLVKTSVHEHLLTLKERKSMLGKTGTLLRPGSAPLVVFVAVAVTVFMLVVASSALITFIMPQSFASTTRLRVHPDATGAPGLAGAQSIATHDPDFVQAQFDVIQSEIILGKVIETLDLNSAWGRKYAGGEVLSTSESLALLKGRLDLRPVRNTALIEIRVFSEDREEAAKLANAIAEAYLNYRQKRAQAAVGVSAPQTALAEIVDRAVPGLRPVRPNKPLNLALGIVIGGIAALGLGAAGAAIALLIGRRHRPPPLPA